MLCDYFHIKGFLGMYSNQYIIFLLEIILKVFTAEEITKS